ncbi:MAG: DUF4271 domain-containing protein [Bacteroidia bacterium]
MQSGTFVYFPVQDSVATQNVKPSGFVWLPVDSGIARGKTNASAHVHAYWKETVAIPDSVKKAILAAEQNADIYHGHQLHPSHSGAKLLERNSPDWLFPIILLVLAIFAALRFFFTKYFSQMITAFVNNNLTNQIVRDENIILQRATIYLSILFNLIAAMFLYLVSIRLGWDMSGIGEGLNRFLFFTGIVSAIYACKFLILKMSGWLFDSEREMAVYIFNIFLINNVLGMILLPIICLMAYNDLIGINFLIFLSSTLVGLAIMYRVFRGIRVGISSPSFSPLYLFLYLCTLEIAPLMVVWRIIAA